MCRSFSRVSFFRDSIKIDYFYFFIGYFRILRLGIVCSESTSISISFNKLLEISRFSTEANKDKSMGNSLILFPYKLSDLSDLSWESKSKYGNRSLICLKIKGKDVHEI